ncbi:MAG: ribokinase, partial [Treponema sp.]|nr:ribokinase [Treponema sp.]
MKVLCYGSINIDLLFEVDHIARPGETVSGKSFVKSAGGKGANQAASLSKAGLNVFMAGKTGADGNFILELLESYGVNTDFVVKNSDSSGQAVIQIDKNGQNSIVLYPGGNFEITNKEIEETIAQFNSGDIIVLQNEINNTGLIIERAKKQGMRICFNPSPYNDKIAEAVSGSRSFLNSVNWLFVNEIEGAAVTGLPYKSANEAILKSLVKMFPETEIILTTGEDGAFYGFEKTIVKTEIVKTPVADTTGAGDTF